MQWHGVQAAVAGRTGYTRAMSPATALLRYRRQLTLGLITILLHLVVFDWFSSQLGRSRDVAVPMPQAPMTAQLIAAAVPAPPVPLSAPQPRLDPPPLPQVPPEPVEVADSAGDPAAGDLADNSAAGDPAASNPTPADSQATGASADASGLTGGVSLVSHDGAQSGVQGNAAVPGQPPAGQAGATGAAAAVKLPAASPAAQAQDLAAAPKPLPEPRRYKIDIPPPADITLDVARLDAKGTRWSGEALLSWTVAPSGYRIRVEAGISVVFTRVNLLTLTSEGAVADEGFAPTLMTEKRRGRSMTATHFNRKEGTLTFSASQAKYALAPGTQDKASLPLQLAAIARGDPAQLSGNIDILVGEDRDAAVFSFVVAGQEEIDTPLGRLATWHLVRPPKPGSYHSRLELWLAPGHDWYPVRIRNVEANGAVTTQTVSKIVKK